jgi:hypothetical protein
VALRPRLTPGLPCRFSVRPWPAPGGRGVNYADAVAPWLLGDNLGNSWRRINGGMVPAWPRLVHGGTSPAGRPNWAHVDPAMAFLRAACSIRTWRNGPGRAPPIGPRPAWPSRGGRRAHRGRSHSRQPVCLVRDSSLVAPPCASNLVLTPVLSYCYTKRPTYGSQRRGARLDEGQERQGSAQPFGRVSRMPVGPSVLPGEGTDRCRSADTSGGSREIGARECPPGPFGRCRPLQGVARVVRDCLRIGRSPRVAERKEGTVRGADEGPTGRVATKARERPRMFRCNVPRERSGKERDISC